MISAEEKLSLAIAELKRDLRAGGLLGRRAEEMVRLTGCSRVEEGECGRTVVLSFAGGECRVPLASLEVTDGRTGARAPAWLEAMVLYYLREADGTLPCGEWISFGQLKDGGFYEKAFQSYTGDTLARTFGNNLDSFRAAARRFGGAEDPLGDAFFRFGLFPRVTLGVVYWLGTEGFPPAAKVVFDGSAGRYLPTGALAVLAAWLCRRLVELAAEKEEGQ